MPGIYAHFRFGKEVLALLPDDLKTIVDRHRELYDIGLHGPDILFYYENMLCYNSVIQRGNAIHEESGEAFFIPAANLLKQARDVEASKAYLFGFICHLALDGECHPYVEKIMSVTGMGHVEIETEMDRFLMLEDGLNPCRQLIPDQIHPSRENAEVIAPFLEPVSEKQVYRSLRDMTRFYRIILPTNGGKRNVLYHILKGCHRYDELQGYILKAEPDPGITPYLPLLEEKDKLAIPKAAEMIQSYEDYLISGEGLSELFQTTFGAGDHWKDLSLND